MRRQSCSAARAADAAVCSWPGCVAACTAATSRWYDVGTTRFAPSSLLGDVSAGAHVLEQCCGLLISGLSSVDRKCHGCYTFSTQNLLDPSCGRVRPQLLR